MEHDFFDMYLEEMRDITPLDRDEMNYVLEGTARGDAGARSRLVEGCLREVLEMVREYGDSELPLSDLVQEANTALMLAAIDYDGSEPWNELMTRRVKESVELALEEQRTENQIEETMAYDIEFHLFLPPAFCALQAFLQIPAIPHRIEAVFLIPARSRCLSFPINGQGIQGQLHDVLHLILSHLHFSGKLLQGRLPA